MEQLNLAWLRQVRRARHISSKRAAAAIGKTRTTLWRYENGRTAITTDDLLALAKLYGGSVADVFCERLGDEDAGV